MEGWEGLVLKKIQKASYFHSLLFFVFFIYDICLLVKNANENWMQKHLHWGGGGLFTGIHVV